MIAAFVGLPAYADPLGDWLLNASKSVPFMELWNDMWSGVGSSIGFIVGAIVPNVAGYVAPYLKVLREHPAIFVFTVGLLLYLYLASDALKQTIAALNRRAWLPKDLSVDASTRLAQIPAPKTSEGEAYNENSLAAFFRKNSVSVSLYQASRNYLFPAIWAVVLLAFLLVLESRVVFMFNAGTGRYCEATREGALIRVIGATSVTARSPFNTDNICWAERPRGEKKARLTRYNSR